ncbi:MAG TPA: hypothetical protein VKG26_01760 [Bacteroidia bacterium]|nr:hypothetical protein [Bacteroidia bacterium]
MALFRLKNLYLSSLLILFTSCAIPSRYKLAQQRVITATDIQPLVSANNSILYKTQIFLFNKYYTGLLLHKQTDSTTSHLVFVTELGMKMFDIEIKKDSLKMLYCFAPMNKSKITTLLENDMGQILLYPILNKTGKIYVNKKQENNLYTIKENSKRYYYYTEANSNKIAKSIVKGKLFTKQKTVYKFDADNLPESVSLKHKGLLRLKIKLNRISTDKAND